MSDHDNFPDPFGGAANETPKLAKRNPARDALEDFKRTLKKDDAPMTRAQLTEYMRLKDIAEGRTPQNSLKEKKPHGNSDDGADFGF